jgi:type IV pilus assembly protein PilY1
VLGDIVNSNPVFVGPPDAGYPDPDYQTFRTTPANFNRPAVIYVAANDGMLHGFCAIATGACTQGGSELFAYVPSMNYDKLPQLTRQGYVHQYYVDSTPTVTDAKVGGAWKTVLVGGLGGGGSGYYALDVTDPANITEATASSTVLWEFKKSDDPLDMGVSLSTAQVVRMKNGQFAAVFGNGYNSSSGKAILYVAFLDGGTDGTWSIGTDVVKITLDNGPNNGLSSPVVSDVDFDGYADYIYAGDLNGNMWKVDVTNVNPNNWDSGGSKTRLFTAKDSSGNLQPITSAPEVTKSPSGGYIVLFGTGKYLETSDTVGPYKTQSFYSVLDFPTGPAPRDNLLRGNLDQRTIATTSIGGVTYRTVAGSTGANSRGWYVDLNISGERVVYAPQLRAGKVIFVTLIPSSSPCDAGGTSWLIELDPISGLPLVDPVFDTNGDGLINNLDVIVSGRQSTVGITPAPTFIGGQSQGGNRDNPRKFLSGSSGQIETVINSDKGSSGRLSWRELLND